MDWNWKNGYFFKFVQVCPCVLTETCLIHFISSNILPLEMLCFETVSVFMHDVASDSVPLNLWDLFTLFNHTIPYHTIPLPYHTIPYHTIPYHTITIPYHTIPYHTIPYHTITIPYHTIPYYTIPYHTIPLPYHYHTIPYHTIPYHTIPYRVFSSDNLFIKPSKLNSMN